MRRVLPWVPWLGVAAFVATVAICAWIVNAYHRYPWLQGELPMISMLGVYSPERWLLSLGFTIVAVAMVVVIVARVRQLGRDPVVAASPILRLGTWTTAALGLLATASFLVMSWIPIDLNGPPDQTQNFVHVGAALATFGLILLSGLVHALTSSLVWRRARPERRLPSPPAIACMFVCAAVVGVGVVFWITESSTLGQHVAVLACFGQFLPLTGALNTASAQHTSAPGGASP